MKETMTRRARDNAYLHKDFHGALSAALDYVERQFGADAVRDYLRQVGDVCYTPLKRALVERGLVAIQEHIERVYAVEGGKVHTTLSANELRVEVDACPAVAHMRAHGYPVSGQFQETHRSVYDGVCDGTPFAFKLVSYDPQTGQSVQRFYRIQP